MTEVIALIFLVSAAHGFARRVYEKEGFGAAVLAFTMLPIVAGMEAGRTLANIAFYPLSKE